MEVMWTFSGPEVEVSKHTPLHPPYLLRMGLYNDELPTVKEYHCVELSTKGPYDIRITPLGNWKIDFHCV